MFEMAISLACSIKQNVQLPSFLSIGRTFVLPRGDAKSVWQFVYFFFFLGGFVKAFN